MISKAAASLQVLGACALFHLLLGALLVSQGSAVAAILPLQTPQISSSLPYTRHNCDLAALQRLRFYRLKVLRTDPIVNSKWPWLITFGHNQTLSQNQLYYELESQFSTKPKLFTTIPTDLCPRNTLHAQLWQRVFGNPTLQQFMARSHIRKGPNAWFNFFAKDYMPVSSALKSLNFTAELHNTLIPGSSFNRNRLYALLLAIWHFYFGGDLKAQEEWSLPEKASDIFTAFEDLGYSLRSPTCRPYKLLTLISEDHFTDGCEHYNADGTCAAPQCETLHHGLVSTVEAAIRFQAETGQPAPNSILGLVRAIFFMELQAFLSDFQQHIWQPFLQMSRKELADAWQAAKVWGTDVCYASECVIVKPARFLVLDRPSYGIAILVLGVVWKLVTWKRGKRRAALEKGTCVVCWVAPRTVTLIHEDSGHHCVCEACALKLLEEDWDCPVCRQPIDSLLKVYHP